VQFCAKIHRPICLRSQPVPLREWVHIAATFTHGRFELYTNGQLASEFGAGRHAVADTVNVIIGKTHESSREFQGMIDDVRLYDYALAAREVRQSACVEPLISDLYRDCSVNLGDLALLAHAWQAQVGDSNWNQVCDISDPSNDVIDMQDLAVLADDWLWGQ
jgi:hypothetical protein